MRGDISINYLAINQSNPGKNIIVVLKSIISHNCLGLSGEFPSLYNIQGTCTRMIYNKEYVFRQTRSCMSRTAITLKFKMSRLLSGNANKKKTTTTTKVKENRLKRL